MGSVRRRALVCVSDLRIDEALRLLACTKKHHHERLHPPLPPRPPRRPRPARPPAAPPPPPLLPAHAALAAASPRNPAWPAARFVPLSPASSGGASATAPTPPTLPTAPTSTPRRRWKPFLLPAQLYKSLLANAVLGKAENIQLGCASPAPAVSSIPAFPRNLLLPASAATSAASASDVAASPSDQADLSASDVPAEERCPPAQIDARRQGLGRCRGAAGIAVAVAALGRPTFQRSPCMEARDASFLRNHMRPRSHMKHIMYSAYPPAFCYIIDDVS
ncbi:Protein of unknown function [Gryllus bimaculatus]|nr:Protein of unknown function [Gryllus bimaculatus]